MGTVGAVCLLFGALDATGSEYFPLSTIFSPSEIIEFSFPHVNDLTFRVAVGTIATVISMASGMAESEAFIDAVQIPCFLGIAGISTLVRRQLPCHSLPPDMHRHSSKATTWRLRATV